MSPRGVCVFPPRVFSAPVLLPPWYCFPRMCPHVFILQAFAAPASARHQRGGARGDARGGARGTGARGYPGEEEGLTGFSADRFEVPVRVPSGEFLSDTRDGTLIGCLEVLMGCLWYVTLRVNVTVSKLSLVEY